MTAVAVYLALNSSASRRSAVAAASTVPVTAMIVCRCPSVRRIVNTMACLLVLFLTGWVVGRTVQGTVPGPVGVSVHVVRVSAG